MCLAEVPTISALLTPASFGSGKVVQDEVSLSLRAPSFAGSRIQGCAHCCPLPIKFKRCFWTRAVYNPNMNSARPADIKMTWRPSTVNEIGGA